MKARWILVVSAGALLLIAAPATAWAAIVGPCDGQVRIAGKVYGPQNDTPSNPIVVPNESGLSARYRGTTGMPIHNHDGAIGVVVGPGTVEVADWGGENAEDEVEAKGDYSVDEARKKVPGGLVGLYRVEGFHNGDEGRCDGFAYVKVEGNPLTTIPGAGAVGLALASVAGLGLAGMARRPV